MIKFDKVTKQFPDSTTALEDIDFNITPGEFISIVGKSGAGKTTILRLMTREDIPTGGVLYIEGVDASTIRLRDLPYLRRKIGVVYQDIKLLAKKNAFENIAFAMEVSGRPYGEIEKEVPELLNLVGLSQRANAFPAEMSGGEQQRIAIARAIAHEPVLFLADEPSGNLDEENALEVLQVLQRINSMGTTVVLATHARELVDRIKKRVIVLEKGKIVSDIAKGKYKLK